MDTPYCLATSPKHVGFSHVPKWLFPTFSFPLMPSTLADHLCRYFTKETTGDTEGLLIFLQQYWIICQHLDAHLPQSLTLPPVKDQTLHHFCSCLSQPYLPHDFILLSFPLWDYFFFYVIPITSPIKKMKTKNLPLHIFCSIISKRCDHVFSLLSFPAELPSPTSTETILVKGSFCPHHVDKFKGDNFLTHLTSQEQ